MSEYDAGMVGSQERRLSRFERIAEQLEKLTSETADRTAHRATAAALLHHKVPHVSWTGFYMRCGAELVVDVYQGPVACLVLPAHKGVCWAAVDGRSTVVVPDVDAFPGHIPCDGRTRSELVVPILEGSGDVMAVLDVDSHRPNRFDDVDRRGYELVVQVLQDGWRAQEAR